ncbi:bromodomain-containing protein 8-like isoform X1 [Ostrea edulis]|uniref:bromodomain-containing protein 8-like isoform X1 n=1 Tax=Ostrea edulis TaxID=37623 RepID=UPI0024AFAA9E|nr:bromodomain-containing protein 8-like isoform X1 [Ostrea edulis]
MAMPKYKLGNVPLDKWSIRERLALACSVLRSGDQNWVSVSRAIRAYGEPNRPQEWFSQKNCALQYAELLEKVETPKRKGRDRGEVETPSLQIMRKLTIERIEELKKVVTEQEQKYKKLKKEVEMIKCGQWDDRLPALYQQMLSEKKEAEDAAREAEMSRAEMSRSTSESTPSGSYQMSASESQTEMEVEEVSQDTDNKDTIVEVSDTTEEKPAIKEPLTVKIEPGLAGEEKPKPSPSPTRLLTTLLSSKTSKVEDLKELKEKTEQQQAKAEAAVAAVPTTVTTVTETPVRKTEEIEPVGADSFIDQTPSSTAPTLTKLLHKGGESKAAVEEEVGRTTMDTPSSNNTIPVEEEIVEIEDVKVEVSEDQEVILQHKVKEEVVNVDQDESQESTDIGFIQLEEEMLKEEPMSPASSVSSKVSECDIKPGSRRSRGRQSGRRRRTKRQKKPMGVKDEESTSRLSDGDTTEDETARESDDTSISGNITNVPTPVPFTESIPSSPLSHCSDTEDEKSYKNWKKSIMLVWRSAANHKYANVFLHPVTNEIAPGYTSIVHRRMDLSQIKKNIESGVIRTTSEFQRDMMLMFTNAIMYNNCNHRVHKMAVEMYNDVLQHIEQYVSTQIMVQTTDTKLLRGSRRVDTSDKEEDSKRRRTSSEQHGEGGKTKKRKTRADDT